ncbi:unnamed protein product [Ilex paraguariensis]|uniref:Uncharacterized protein n=1 Tax=Ilex paraguariensis TaxID=185542 RepID=A0ABC8RH16_9AQUA
MLKWSPTGDYFFTAKFDGTFYLWETNTWTSEPWSSTSGFVTVVVDNALNGGIYLVLEGQDGLAIICSPLELAEAPMMEACISKIKDHIAQFEDFCAMQIPRTKNSHVALLECLALTLMTTFLG